jgi:hypothetical protein
MIRRTLTLLLASSAVLACGARQLPPPEAPPKVVPEILGVPEAPPREGTGRLLIDNHGETAKVARVNESGNAEVVCITPCAIDANVGAQTFVFTSLRDEERTSRADVTIVRGTSVVRHALGRETPPTTAFGAGWWVVYTGTVLTAVGGLFLAQGLAGDPRSESSTTIGAVAGTAGIAALVSGILLLTSGRPAKQPGATTTFQHPRLAP